jgi:hypothetical protein
MSKPELPPCSARDCERVAGAVVEGVLLCPEHGLEALEKRRAARLANLSDDLLNEDES